MTNKLIGVQEMKERTVAPEDEFVQKVVSGGDPNKAIPHEFRTLEEQLKRNGSLIIQRIRSKNFDSIHERVRRAVEMLYTIFQVKENDAEYGPVATDQKGCVIASRFLLKMLSLEQDSVDDGATAKMNWPMVQLDEGIPSLLWTQSLRGLHVGTHPGIWFAFYGDGDIVMHKQLAHGEGSTTYAFKYNQHDLREFYAMILEFGGNPDA